MVTIEYYEETPSSDIPPVKKIVSLTGTRVGHRIEQLSFPVITIWSNEMGIEKTLVFIKPIGAVVTVTAG